VTITGKVLDARDNEALVGALIKVLRNTHGTLPAQAKVLHSLYQRCL
jgi:hypothetical protein